MRPRRCGICKRSVRDITSWQEHNVEFHNEFKCPDCICSYWGSEAQLHSHRKNKHRWCSRCEQNNQSSHHLRVRQCTRVTFLAPAAPPVPISFTSSTTPRASVATRPPSQWRSRLVEDEDGETHVIRFKIRKTPY